VLFCLVPKPFDVGILSVAKLQRSLESVRGEVRLAISDQF
jgi:hypothetical protein